MWTEQWTAWDPDESRVEKLGSERRLLLATACLNDAIQFYTDVSSRKWPHKIETFIVSFVELLGHSYEETIGLERELEECMIQANEVGAPPGLCALLEACEYVRYEGPLSTSNTFASMVNSYWVVLDLEVLSKLTTFCDEGQVRIIERQTASCVKALNRQLEFLRELEEITTVR